ncbi:MAG: exodeoxyribonuclease III [Opitutales bacterium]|nr:exodeoxyribonuclease III [Opitutales bacterium]
MLVWEMRLYSWNVNGFRAVLKKGFADFWAETQPDILALQEIKARPEQVDFSPEGYHAYWHPAEKPGYSGTAVFSRHQAEEVSVGIPSLKEDPEGRVQRLTFPGFHLVNVYVPNAKRDLSRLEYREKVFDPALKAYLQELDRDRPVIFCGDFNVAHEEIDLANPRSNRRNAGFTDEERKGFGLLLEAGFVDTFRVRHPGETGHYSWWSYRAGARGRNVGWRIDYVGVSERLDKEVKKAFILPQVMGSDHCPVGIELAK